MSATPISQLFVNAWTESRALIADVAALVKAQLHADGGKVAGGTAMFVAALACVAGVVPLLILALVWGIVALGLPAWAAYLIVAGVVILVAVGLALAGKALFKSAAKSSKQTIEQVKTSIAALKGQTEPAGPPGEDV
jgi:hypothetical protein